MEKVSFLLILYFNFFNLSSQNWEWTKIAGGEFNNTATSVASDLMGNVYIAGNATSDLIIENDTLLNPWFCGFIAKYDKGGNYQWINRAGNEMKAITTDAEGNAYIAGTIAGQGFNNQYNLFSSTDNDSVILNCRGEFDIAIAKYAPDGKLLWVRTAGGKKWDEPRSISVDDQGNCYVTGVYRDTADFGNDTLPYEKPSANTYYPHRFFITKVDFEGNFIWTRFAFGPENDYSYVVGQSVNAGEDGFVYVTGSFLGGLDFGEGKVLNGQGSFVCKFSASGYLQWVKPTGEGDYIPGVSDKEGNFYVAASKYLSKFDKYGNLIYNNTIIQSSHPNNGQISSIALDTINDKIFISGRFSSIPTIFGSSENSITLTSSKISFDAFIACFDNDGRINWVIAPTGDSLGQTWALDIASDQKGNCYVAGNFGGAGATNFGSTHFEDISPAHIFVSKIRDLDVPLNPGEPQSGTYFTIYPNPTTGTFQINYFSPKTEKSQLNIYNSKGSIVYKETFQGDYNGSTKLTTYGSTMFTTTINLGTKAKGIYFIEILAGKKRTVRRIVLN